MNKIDRKHRRAFESIRKAIDACRNSGQTVGNHFAEVRKMVTLGSGAKREVRDYRLTRYDCYLVVQNGDPAKPVIAPVFYRKRQRVPEKVTL